MSVAPPRVLKEQQREPKKFAKKPRHATPKPEAASSGATASVSPCVKAVIRLLPPTLTQESFFKQLASYTSTSPEVIVTSYYVEGHYSKTPYERPTYSRCYILFSSREFLTKFVAEVRDKPFAEELGPRDSLIPVIGNSPFYNDMPPPDAVDSAKEKPTEKAEEEKQLQVAQTPKKTASIDDDFRFVVFLRHLAGTLPSYSLDTVAQISAQEKRKKLLLKKQQLKARAKAKAIKRDNDSTSVPKSKTKKKKKNAQSKQNLQQSQPESSVEAADSSEQPAKSKSRSKKRRSKKAKTGSSEGDGAKESEPKELKSGIPPESTNTPAKSKKRNKPKSKNKKTNPKVEGGDDQTAIQAKPKQKKSKSKLKAAEKSENKPEKLEKLAEKSDNTPSNIVKPKKILAKRPNPAQVDQ